MNVNRKVIQRRITSTVLEEEVISKEELREEDRAVRLTWMPRVGIILKGGGIFRKKKKSLIPELGKGKYKMSFEQLAVSENKKILK